MLILEPRTIMIHCISGQVKYCHCARVFAYNTLHELPTYKTNLPQRNLCYLKVTLQFRLQFSWEVLLYKIGDLSFMTATEAT